jgi:ferric-dicitrate binding protein FerR (iron transport regulator)
VAGDTNGSVKAPIRTGRRGLYRVLLMATALVAGAILVNRIDHSGTMSGSTREGTDMEAVHQVTLSGRTMPPIDAAAPVRTDTATFAMG